MEPQIRLFVGNLPGDVDKKDLSAAFSNFGTVTHLDLKSKLEDGQEKKSFAFITLSASEANVESCIKHFSHHSFNETKLYVTRARESFLERLQRERQEQDAKKLEKIQHNPYLHKYVPVIRLGEKLTPKVKKNAIMKDLEVSGLAPHSQFDKKKKNSKDKTELSIRQRNSEMDDKKQNADKKRLDSMKKKRQEFKEKQQLIKMSLKAIDEVKNKKLIFPDDEVVPNIHPKSNSTKRILKKGKPLPLFDNADDSGDEIKFNVKKEYEGKKGQKVLELQSRYKSDKRFVLDERFIDDEHGNSEAEDQNIGEGNENVELSCTDEKMKQLNILQDVLGVVIKKPVLEATINSKTVKAKLGMLRFDPSHPEHAKFLAPMEEQHESGKKHKKKKKDIGVVEVEEKMEVEPEVRRPEVSKEQFYKVSETLKEAIAQPTTFSLRSLFGNVEEEQKTEEEQSNNYTALVIAKDQPKTVNNLLYPAERNPFVYDSSDSEDETKAEVKPVAALPTAEPKAVWKENLFFTVSDSRLKEGLAFFNIIQRNEGQKERRELKSLMKRRIYNKERKNQMFQKKIGGRRKSMKKGYRKKNN